jgi:hypothetical protein
LEELGQGLGVRSWCRVRRPRRHERTNQKEDKKDPKKKKYLRLQEYSHFPIFPLLNLREKCTWGWYKPRKRIKVRSG